METPVKKTRSLRTWTPWVLVALIGVPIALCLVGVIPWTPVNCEYQDVDISSGRLRFTRCFFWIPVRQQVEDSALTKFLAPEDLGRAPPEWRRVNTFSPGVRHSPHHRYHGAVSQIESLSGLWDLSQFTPGARRASARRMLELWRRGGSYFAASEYLDALWNRFQDVTGQVQEVDVEALTP